MKKRFLACIICLAMLLAVCAGCAPRKEGDVTPNPSPTETPDKPTPPDPVDPGFSYYKQTQLRNDKTVYLVSSSNNDEAITLQTIQGLFARDRVTFYFNGGSATNSVNTDLYHLEQAKTQYGLTIAERTFAEAVAMYRDAWADYVAAGVWGSEIPLEDYVSNEKSAYVEAEPRQGYKTPGYILYKKGTVQVNVASTLAGVTGFLPVEADRENEAIALGLTKKFDINSIVFGYKWIYETTFSEIGNEGLIYQAYESAGGTSNQYVRDIGVTYKYMHVYYDNTTNAPMSFRKNLHKFLNPSIPILGYTFDEGADVAFFSEYGQFIVPTDYSFNLTFFAAEEFGYDKNGGLLKFEQPNKDNTAAEKNKHYVAFLFSDGDNATMWQNTMPFAANMMKAAGREDDRFPVGWGITPSLANLMPGVLNSVYNNLANGNDYFAVPVCGQGYIDPYNYMQVDGGKYFDDFLSKLDIYMKRSDLNLVTCFPGGDWADKAEIFEKYGAVDAVKGGVVYDGNKYFGAVRGGVYWANGKPFVGPRDSLWETTPAYLAARLNTYERDSSTIDGYSLINVHPWSHSYQDVRAIVNMLDDNVVVVSPDRLYELMSENITDKTNSEGGYKIPQKNGVSISVEDLQENPDLIPVDPLLNDFLLWQEDWEGTGITHTKNDEAASNVGASFHASIGVQKGTTAVKKTFTLPKLGDLWINFNARAASQNADQYAKFSLTMTVDGVTKTVIDSATVRGVAGTGTAQNLTGDGWQFFAFPISQYFSEYQNKPASLALTVDSSGDVGVKLDRFEVAQRLDSALSGESYDPLDNQFLNGNTEDWRLGHVYMTTQYVYWGALDKATLKPFDGGALQVDCSDGGGSEKRNGNSNMFMAKTYTLPESDAVTLNFKADGQALYKVSVYVNGKYYVAKNWQSADASGEVSVNISEALGADISGKAATVVFECRDDGIHNGDSQLLWLRYFKTLTAR